MQKKKCKTVSRIHSPPDESLTGSAPSEDRTHYLETMRLARCQLRYRDLLKKYCGREHILLNIT